MSSLHKLGRAPRFLITFLLAVSLAACTLAFAAAVSLTDLNDSKLAPSGTPQLLGPITQAGRKGWECTPERAAAAKSPISAALPSAGLQP
ncbi:MAG: hypothetical protein M3126_02440 [Candidatus Eremiobacteraeota bacterium]|nr:hypothetical protein [Candidatus Eremiobacteraeota bacterium]